MYDTAQPRGALEYLVYGSGHALVGVGDDEPDARHAAAAELPREAKPRAIRLGVHDRHPQDVSPPFGIAADGGDDRRGGDPPLPAALDVGDVQTAVRRDRAVRVAPQQLSGVGVMASGDSVSLVPAEPADAHLGGNTLHLPSARAHRIHLGHRRRECAVDSLISLETSSEKKLPVLNFGTLSVSLPTQASRHLSR